jgi:tripartite-type tricarboxylate transporter receptor subunit TctC
MDSDGEIADDRAAAASTEPDRAARSKEEETMRSFGIGTVLALACLLMQAAGQAGAEEAYPDHTVKIVVPSAGGSTTDTLARIVAEQLAQTWGKPVIVENISGGGMIVGTSQVAHAPPDGYTLLVSPPSPITFNHLLYRELPYEPSRFAPVSLLARVPNALVVKNDLPAGNVKELIAYAKANPGKVTYGSQGAGSTAHLSAGQLEMLAGVKMVHIPYRGAVAALNDVVAGHIDMFFDTVTTSTPMFRAGKVKILGVGGTERSPLLPEVPTIAESGVPGFRSVTWFAIVAPPGTPAALAEKISRDVVEGLARPEVKDKLARLTLEPIAGTPAAATRFFAEETALWGKVIKENHVTVE